jgi:transcriptional regulator with XRE-family HTH domain
MALKRLVRPNGSRIRELREGKGLTQEELAQRIFRSRYTVWKAENGRLVSKAVMGQLARTLKASYAEVTLPAEEKQAA